jgi:hypothetical protein
MCLKIETFPEQCVWAFFTSLWSYNNPQNYERQYWSILYKFVSLGALSFPVSRAEYATGTATQYFHLECASASELARFVSQYAGNIASIMFTFVASRPVAIVTYYKGLLSETLDPLIPWPNRNIRICHEKRVIGLMKTQLFLAVSLLKQKNVWTAILWTSFWRNVLPQFRVKPEDHIPHFLRLKT